jgi:ATP-binding cassette subfamily B protein
MVGLVGKSGAGKSTLINLICRFYDPDSGRILVDGSDLREYALADWRRQLGIVLQEPFLFHASILDNLRAVRPEASLAEVVKAARAACAHEFILQKPDGYDTIVGEGGVNLSAGERQRIAIARAILADPPILILDEATAAIDTETERDMQEAIARLVRGRTTIAIAHRLATLRNAGRLVVIDDGQVVESGSHDDLLSRPGGRFRRLVEMQREVNRMRGEQVVVDG